MPKPNCSVSLVGDKSNTSRMLLPLTLHVEFAPNTRATAPTHKKMTAQLSNSHTPASARAASHPTYRNTASPSPTTSARSGAHSASRAAVRIAPVRQPVE